MVRRHRRQLHVLIGTAVLITACSPGLEGLAGQNGIQRDALVRLSDGRAVAARVLDDRVEVLDFRQGDEGWRVELRAAGTPARSEGSVRLATTGQLAPDEWKTYVYGTAPQSVSRVVVEGIDGVGGQVVDGAWVVASRQAEISPAHLSWVFLDATGNLVLSGTGVSPPLR